MKKKNMVSIFFNEFPFDSRKKNVIFYTGISFKPLPLGRGRFFRTVVKFLSQKISQTCIFRCRYTQRFFDTSALLFGFVATAPGYIRYYNDYRHYQQGTIHDKPNIDDYRILNKLEKYLPSID